MRVLVCGSRTFNNKELMFNTLEGIATEFDLWAEPDEYGNTLPLKMEIIEGGARGADALAHDYAVVMWLKLHEYPADWNKHGKAAGVIRNQQMLDEGKPDLVICFWDGKSRGTFDMKERAAKQGYSVRVIKF